MPMSRNAEEKWGQSLTYPHKIVIKINNFVILASEFINEVRPSVSPCPRSRAPVVQSIAKQYSNPAPPELSSAF